MTAEASRKRSHAETTDAFGPPGSGATSGKFSATPPDPANMAALLMSMMERMERSERRTASVIGEMQTRLAEMSRQAEEAGAAADEAAGLAERKPGVDTFALLEQRLGAFQVPAPDSPAGPETAAPAYRAEAKITFTAANPESIPARRSEDTGRDRQHGESPAARPAPAEAVMFVEAAKCAARRSASEPPPANDRQAPTPHSLDGGEPAAPARAAIPLADQFKSGGGAPRKPAPGAAAEPPPLRQPQANIGIPNNDERPTGQWPAWRAPCRRETPDADERLAERCRFEDQFEGLAARLEGALSAQQSGSEIEALSDKLDAVSRELANALAEPAEALNSIEHQLTDIARSFGNTEQRFQKMNDIESHLAKVLSALNDSPGMIDRAAETAAARVMERTSSAPNDSLAVRFDAMHAELSAFDSRSRAQADRLSGAIESMQRMLNNLTDTQSGPTRAHAAPPRVEEKRAASASPSGPSAADFARQQSNAKLDADFDDEPTDAQSNTPEVRDLEPVAQGSSLRDRLGAAIPDFQQPAAAQLRARQSQSGDHQASGPAEKKDDFIAAARKAAQAAAAKANEKSKPAAQMREPANQKPSSKGAETHLSRPRPILVISAAVLLIASAALLYTRLQSKPAAPSVPAVEQQQGKDKADEPAKSSNAQSESMLALGSGEKEVRKFNDRLSEDAQPAATSRDEADIGSVVVKSLGDDETALNAQVALPPAMVGPYSMRLAAARGEMVAQYVVASRFAEGKGVPQNWEEASRWYARAAAQGHAPAQYRLAVLFERGQGVEKDAARARVWYTRAADQGSLKAMHNLAVTMSGPDATPDDHAIAAQWFAKAAEQGLADSQFNLAIFFENGLGLNRDVVEAYKWYSLAANQMDVEAAKRRDLLKAQLDEKALAAADKAVKAWRPVPPKKEANDVETSDATWGETAADL